MPSAESDELRQMKGQWSIDRQPPDRRRRHWPLLRLLIVRTPGEKAARVPLGSYEFEKKGIARVDLSDSLSPRHRAHLAAIPCGAPCPLSRRERRRRDALFARSRLRRERSARQFRGCLLL